MSTFPEKTDPEMPEAKASQGTGAAPSSIALNRRNLLLAASAVAAPALGASRPAAAETAGAVPQRFEYPAGREAKSAARAQALESLLIEKGIITDKTVDGVLAFFEKEMGPFNGAKIVAKAWVDPAFKQKLVDDTPAAIAQMNLPKGMAGAEGEHMRAVANGDGVHNLIICTLCSCYPWPVLGLPPYWYKDPTFRARSAREPRAVLAEFGLKLDPAIQIKTWDSSAQIRWFVVPERPKGTEHMNEAQLAALVTPESMMGVAVAKAA